MPRTAVEWRHPQRQLLSQYSMAENSCSVSTQWRGTAVQSVLNGGAQLFSQYSVVDRSYSGIT